MLINILQGIEGAKKARGLTVIIDVFRAFSVEAYIASTSPKMIIPVGKVEEAFFYHKQYQNSIIIGERKGKKIEGFDYGNSPTQIKDVDFKDQIIIHTTSAGTQGIIHAKNASEIITGSLVNASAVAKYIQLKAPEVVSLVCMGLEGIEPTDEDTLCARYIQSLLEENTIDLENEIEKIKATSGKKFFDENQQDVFPMSDFYLSTKVDLFDFVLVLKDGILEKATV